jgi:hypothetical protein
VIKAIEAKDCAGAVRELNAALASGTAEALLLGGSMFEQGLCLKPNAERAARLYQKAAEAGGGGARSRLAALYASAAGGPDKGAAMWWALQAGLPLPGACKVAPELVNDADRFAQALSTWPAAQLDACVYVTGVLASIDAEFALSPEAPAAHGVGIDFQPAAGRVEVGVSFIGQEGKELRPVYTMNGSQTSITYAHDPSPDQLRELQLQAGRQELAKQVDKVAADALKRFPRPASVNGDWRIRLRVEGGRTS